MGIYFVTSFCIEGLQNNNWAVVGEIKKERKKREEGARETERFKGRNSKIRKHGKEGKKIKSIRMNI